MDFETWYYSEMLLSLFMSRTSRLEANVKLHSTSIAKEGK